MVSLVVSRLVSWSFLVCDGHVHALTQLTCQWTQFSCHWTHLSRVVGHSSEVEEQSSRVGDTAVVWWFRCPWLFHRCGYWTGLWTRVVAITQERFLY